MQVFPFFCPVQVLKYLEEYVLPQGVHAIPLQGLEWLTTCVDCLNSGSVTISNSKTDYVLLTDKGFQTLQDLKKGEIRENLAMAS